MAAPKSNQFWKLRSKHGRDKLFATPELLWEASVEYFEWCDDNPEYLVEQKKGTTNIKLTMVNSLDMDELKGELENLVYVPTKKPYTIQGLCLYLGCNVMYINQFEDGLKGKKDEMSIGFSLILTRIREIIYNQKFIGASVGYFNSSIIARDLGLVDKKGIEGELTITQITGMEIK
jgi:hypothetical protein